MTKKNLNLVALGGSALAVVALFLPLASVFGFGVNIFDVISESVFHVITLLATVAAVALNYFAMSDAKFSLYSIVASVVSVILMFLAMIDAFSFMGIGFILFVIGSAASIIANVLAMKALD